MMSWLREFLWSPDFLPHAVCLSWRPDLVMLMAGSELLLGAAYIWVAVSLAVFVRRRADFPYRGALTLFSLVFAACGAQHLSDMVVLWLPWYGALALFKAVVAVVSVPAAVVMWRLLPRALQLPSPAALRRTNEELAREVAHHRRTEEQLIAARDAAEQASRAKSAFLATMSHELRTPLNAIIGFSDALAQGHFGALADRQVEYIEAIHASGQHLLRLINDILDISRIDAGKMALDEDEVDLAALVQAAVALVSDAAGRGGVGLVVDIADQPPRVLGDQRRLRQVLLNLLSNAVKFTPPGGRVTVAARQGEDGGVAVEVADTGIGMAADDIPRAFEMFTQVDNPMSRRFDGSGIGLPLSRALVEMHGGALTLTSQPGMGTTATVRLPAERVKEDDDGTRAGRESLRGLD